jgi:multimeric flavodoxin WrbA
MNCLKQVISDNFYPTDNCKAMLKPLLYTNLSILLFLFIRDDYFICRDARVDKNCIFHTNNYQEEGKMKVLGISGSPRKNHTTDILVKEVLNATGCENEFISLAGMQISPCIACLGCVKDNICKINDDMQALREKIVEADAYVIGAANYYSMLNALTHCFLERFYQFRHREGKNVSGKLAVAVGVGGGDGAPVIDNLKNFFQYHQLNCVGELSAQGAACCFTCGFGEDCKVGAIHMFFGPGTKITPDMIPNISKQPEKLEEARLLGEKLGKQLKGFAAAT